MSKKGIENLIVDTTAFIQNVSLQDYAENLYTCQEVIDEINNKRQLRRLAVLPYELKVKYVEPESVKVVTDFSKKTGDYPSLSSTDIKVIALTYQLEKEKHGTDHLRTEPVFKKSITYANKSRATEVNTGTSGCNTSAPGFYMPETEKTTELESKYVNNQENNSTEECESNEDDDAEDEEEKDDEENEGWITPSVLKKKQKEIQSEFLEEKNVSVSCMTTDFAMQNVLKQMNLNICALDGRVIKHLRTFILRCYACFKTTSKMDKVFCPNCGNNTLKKVAYSIDEEGKMQIHINLKKPLTGRGKKFSLPTFKGGKHPNNPIIVEDQPLPQNRASKLAKQKNDPFDDKYVIGYSPFVTRDVMSKSAMLNIKPGQTMKHWMKHNPNEARRKKK